MENRTNRALISLIVILVVGGLLLTIFVLGGSGKRTPKEQDKQSSPPKFSDEQLCGPISLHNAACMIGIQIDRRELLKACPPSAAGVSMAALADAAKKFGLDAKGHRMTWEQLLQLRSPAVLYINPNHFVSVSPSQYASDRFPNSIRVFDPVEAPQWWSREKLEKSWSGATLVISEASRPKRAAGPQIRFQSLIHDVGDVQVPLGEKINISLQLTNTGGQTLEIGNIKTSCGCTKTAVPHKTLDPGKKGTIDLAIDLDAIRGPFNHTVAVETNDKVTAIAEVVITGRTYNIRLTAQREVLFNAVPRAGHTSKSVVLKDPGDGSLKDSVTSASISPQSLSNEKDAIYIKSAVCPFDPNKHSRLEAKKDDVVVDIELSVSDSAPIGQFDAVLEITTKIPGNEHITIPLRGTVISSIAVTPAALVFSGDKGDPISRTVKIESRTGKNLDLKAISIPENLPIKAERQSDPNAPILLAVTYSPSPKIQNTAAGDIRCTFADETVIIPVVIHPQPSK